MPSPESWRHTFAAPWDDSFELVTRRLAMPVGLCFLVLVDAAFSSSQGLSLLLSDESVLLSEQSGGSELVSVEQSLPLSYFASMGE